MKEHDKKFARTILNFIHSLRKIKKHDMQFELRKIRIKIGWIE